MFGTIVYFQVPTGLTQINKGYVHIAQMEQNFLKNRIEYNI